ncbi:MAG: glycoside hydrolase family 88 protein [Chloroflexi bacterium]|nr:glycoside hydrolase family 88 protein [Chloroflexota bacterium]
MTQRWSVRMADSTMARFDALADEWNYQWGLVLRGFEQVWRATGDDKYFAYMQSNIDRFVQPDGTIRGYHVEEYNVDRLNTGKVLFPLYEKTGDAKYKRALDLLRAQLDTHPRTNSRGFWHKQIYPYQMWLDGLYMATAFWAQYESSFASQRAEAAHRPNHTLAPWDDIAHQFVLIEAHTRDPQTGLLYHAWNESKQQLWANPQTGCSSYFWGRAIGWYVMALVDVLGYMPSDHPTRALLLAILTRTLEAVMRVQDPATGVWYQILDQGTRAGNYLESSGSCMFVCAMASGARLGYLNAEYARVAQRAFEGIVQQFVTTNDDGTINLTHTCRSAGLGGTPYRDGSFEYYINEPIVTNNHHGVGAFILASAEIEKLG